MFRRVLAAIDASPSRHKVLAVAEHLATSCNDTTVCVLDIGEEAVAEHVAPRVGGLSGPSEVTLDSVRRLRDAGVDAVAATHDELRMDTARDVLAHAQAHAADLIVMAPHHRTMMAGAFFGTLAQSLDQGINVSLLFVH